MGYRFSLLLTMVVMVGHTSSQVYATEEGVENVHFSVQDRRVTIGYDLIGKGTYEVSLGLFQYLDGTIDHSSILEKVSGDIGPGVKPGKGKQIIWEIGNPSGVGGMDFYFEVRALRTVSPRKWPWITGGVAGVAIGAAYWERTRSPQSTITIDVPDPE